MKSGFKIVRLEAFVGKISLRMTALSLVLAMTAACSGSRDSATKVGAGGGAGGGRLTVTYRSEPRSFNRYVSPYIAEETITRLIHATLVRLNRATRQVEPRLAHDWTVSPDGLTWTFHLEPNVSFSDGTPFTSADVLFSFQGVYDPKVESPLASSLTIGGQPLMARAPDEHTVIVTLPGPYGAGVGLLDSLPIYPRHKLQPALAAGAFKDAWGVKTPPADLVGLGPFVIAKYEPGVRIEFARNPHYWRKDAAGHALPYLDGIEMQIVPDQNAEVLRLQSGDVDLTTDQVRAEDLAALRALEAKGVLQLATAGPTISPDVLWLNLTPGAAVAKARPWLQKEELRRAISYAVDRRSIVNTVYLGAAEPIWGPITPGHGEWFQSDLPRTEADRTKAKSLLASIGLTDRTGDGLVDDPSGKTARFSILVPKHTTRDRVALMIQEQLRQAGLTVDLVATDPRAMAEKFEKGDYDAVYFAFLIDTFEPAPDFWLSSGPFHVWNHAQKSPATSWEGQIDDLFRKASTTLDANERHRLFGQAQRVFAEHLPAVYFVATNVTVAASARVHGIVPSVLPPPVLWNAEMLSVGPAPSPGSTQRR
jgi:peptide/nickel transport system substrate-binding protein